jgi:membrane protease YdiL (CAAX protease family)
LLAAFLLLVTTGFVEEVIFRGVLQRSAVQVFGGWGLVDVSLLFAVAHWIHNSLIDIVYVFVIALFFAWVVKKTGSLFGVTLAHGIANIVLFLVATVLF